MTDARTPAQLEAFYRNRRKAEARFRLLGKCAITTAICILLFILTALGAQGIPGFLQTQIKIPVIFDAEKLSLQSGEKADAAPASSFQRLAQSSLKAEFPEAADHDAQKQLLALLSANNGNIIKQDAAANPSLLGTTADEWLLASSVTDLYFKDKIQRATPEADRALTDQQLNWLDGLKAKGAIRTGFNTNLFTQGDSRTPEQAGFLGAIIGSLLTMVVCLSVVFPIGVATAVYLEEFARKNRWTDLIEVNINNLAAVPSIVFGLLGLAVYINVLGFPRSAPLVGGMTLAMMILPVIIITTRVSIAAIPPSIRDAARGLGASPVQVVWHHVLPLAMPGIMTGTILGMARAIGETAPLIMIGMVAFVADLPSGFKSSATVMPVQVYLWASSPEAGFAEKTAAGILILLVILLALNALAIFLRKRFEVRW
jgi:phosphate transport system permease protein